MTDIVIHKLDKQDRIAFNALCAVRGLTQAELFTDLLSRERSRIKSLVATIDGEKMKGSAASNSDTGRDIGTLWTR